MDLSARLKAAFNDLSKNGLWDKSFFKKIPDTASGQQSAWSQEMKPDAIVAPIEPLKPLEEKLSGGNLRVLTNPETRVALRPDFPVTLSIGEPKKLLHALDDELKKHGMSIKDTPRINIAYPHKHPEMYPGHRDNAAESVERLLNGMELAGSKIDWLPADAICETVRLGRSEDQSSAHALASHQVFDIHMPSQRRDMPFLKEGNQEKEFFVVADWCVEQGTTVANLVSYIEHNGGIVLAVLNDCGNSPLVQQKTDDSWVKGGLSDAFGRADLNTGRLPQMAATFARSAREAGKDWSPQECMEKFEAALKKCGNTVFAMTDGECRRVIDTVNHHHYNAESFLSLLGKLEERGEKYQNSLKKPAPARDRTANA
jgi:hypothetical protein